VPFDPSSVIATDDQQARGNPPQPVPDRTIRQPLSTFEEAWRIWESEIGMMKDRFKKPPKPKNKKRRRVVVIPDLHVPYHEASFLQQICVREKDADVACLAGDLMDSYAVSKYVQYKRVPAEVEWSQAHLVLGKIAETWPDVRLILGNHDKRLDRQLRASLSLDMIEAITMITGGVLDPVSALCRRFSNVTISKHQIPNTDMTLDWLMSVGDVLIAHPETFSRVPSTSSRKFEEWIADNTLQFQFDKYRAILIGHTHQLSAFPWRGSSQLLMEIGCLCKPMDYQTSPRIGGRPQVRSYVFLEQDKQKDGSWTTDLNSVGWHCFEWDK